MRNADTRVVSWVGRISNGFNTGLEKGFKGFKTGARGLKEESAKSCSEVRMGKVGKVSWSSQSYKS